MKTRTFYIILFVAVIALIMMVMACGPSLLMSGDEILATAKCITVTPSW